MPIDMKFEYNEYGSYTSELYSVEFYQGAWHCFRDGVLFGPNFTHSQAAMNFCQKDRENA